MTATATSVRLILTDLGANNNKWWHGRVEGSTVVCEWGRVGAPKGQSGSWAFGSTGEAEDHLAKKIAEKERKGYVRQHTVGEAAPVSVAALARKQIQHGGDKETAALVDFLVQRNVHRIEGATDIRFTNGQATTPLGPVTEEGLAKAERLLDWIGAKVEDGDFSLQFSSYVNQYLQIVPRNIGQRRTSPRELLGSIRAVRQERSLLDSLRAVIANAEQLVATGTPVFQTKLSLVPESDPEWDRIMRFYAHTRNTRHSSYGMRLKKVWKVTLPEADAQFEAHLGNVKELWHGTKDANLLSILKSGYIVPRPGGSVAITGRMFGDGIYFSDQSTKSLNYATGSAPGQYGSGRSSRCFMLLNDVALGKMHRPSRSLAGKAPKGFDSVFAEAGRSGVMNNEYVALRSTQVRPTYLCEFA